MTPRGRAKGGRDPSAWASAQRAALQRSGEYGLGLGRHVTASGAVRDELASETRALGLRLADFMEPAR